MRCLEIVCPCSIEVISHIFEILAAYQLSIDGIESDPSGFIYIVISDLDFADLKELLTGIRCLDSVLDARVVGMIPSELGDRQIQLLLDQIIYPVLLVDRNGLILHANQASAFACQSLFEQLLGRPLTDFVKGFSISRWLGSGNGRTEFAEVYLGERPYRAFVEPLADELSLSHFPSVLMVFRLEGQYVPNLDLASIRDSFAPFGLIAQANEYSRVIEQLQQIAQQPRPLLLYGEVGSGKRFSAKLLNHLQGNSLESMPELAGPIDDTALDEQLLEIAINRPEMVLVYQLENFSSEQLPRIMAQLNSVKQVTFTSQYSPERLIEQIGNELFYSGIGQCIEIAPLRNRPDDIVALAQAWLDEYYLSLGRSSLALSKSVQQFLKKCQWPGNIAQLLQVLRDTMARTGPRAWIVRDIQYEHRRQKSEPMVSGLLDKDYHQAMNDFERLLLSYHYPQYPSTRSLAKKLGLSHTAVAKKLKEHKLT
ncbi:TyrR/PhhR family helix-turn-helix DNA-binding protein [Celerinatantimonas yamalensis]|uniref:TyrR/PhhR family helix-turn-helix DNA-binding protein n=1 Tax=Celerinatantimonas yamalensis TaxID=559956 RepID=A0ABW9G4B1_9GAMM